MRSVRLLGSKVCCSPHDPFSYPHTLFSIPIPNNLCQTISLLWGNLGNSRIGSNGDSIFCRHRFGNSFLHCNFYYLWVFSNTNWLHCQLGMDFKREIKNISLWDDDVCNARNCIRNNLPTHLSWKYFTWDHSIWIIHWVLDPAINLLGFANTYIFYFVLYFVGMDITYVANLPTEKTLPVSASVKNTKGVELGTL